MKTKGPYLSIWHKLTLSALSVILFFSLAEVALRFMGFKYNLCEEIPTAALSSGLTKKIFGVGCIPSTVLGYELEPNFKGEMWDTWVSVNSKGFRDREFSVQKKPDTLRIICLGDSCTFGVKVKPEDTYPKRLEYILNKNKKSKLYEVLNVGCAGYTSFIGLKMLEDKDLLAYSPDIILIYFGMNDEYNWHAFSDSLSYKIRMLNRNFQRSRLYSFLWRLISEKLLKDNLRLTNRIGKLALRVTPKEFEENLKNINKLLQNRKIKVLFLTYPSKPELFPNNEYQSLERLRAYNNIIREASKQYGVALLDLEKIFTERYNNNGKLFADYVHPSYYGHVIIAEEIYRKLTEENFITANSALTNYLHRNDIDGYSFLNNLDQIIINASVELTPTLAGCTINKDFRYCISQHPPSELIYHVHVSRNWAKLKFGIGLFPTAWLMEKGDGVEFKIDVAVQDGGRLHNIFSKYIDPKNKP